MKKYSEIIQEKYSYGDDVIDDVTRWPKIPLYMK